MDSAPPSPRETVHISTYNSERTVTSPGFLGDQVDISPRTDRPTPEQGLPGCSGPFSSFAPVLPAKGQETPHPAGPRGARVLTEGAARPLWGLSIGWLGWSLWLILSLSAPGRAVGVAVPRLFPWGGPSHAVATLLGSGSAVSAGEWESPDLGPWLCSLSCA